jgi:hypothetical protein
MAFQDAPRACQIGPEEDLHLSPRIEVVLGAQIPQLRHDRHQEGHLPLRLGVGFLLPPLREGGLGQGSFLMR